MKEALLKQLLDLDLELAALRDELDDNIHFHRYNQVIALIAAKTTQKEHLERMARKLKIALDDGPDAA